MLLFLRTCSLQGKNRSTYSLTHKLVNLLAKHVICISSTLANPLFIRHFAKKLINSTERNRYYWNCRKQQQMQCDLLSDLEDRVNTINMKKIILFFLKYWVIYVQKLSKIISYQPIKLSSYFWKTKLPYNWITTTTKWCQTVATVVVFLSITKQLSHFTFNQIVFVNFTLLQYKSPLLPFLGIYILFKSFSFSFTMTTTIKVVNNNSKDENQFLEVGLNQSTLRTARQLFHSHVSRLACRSGRGGESCHRC